MKFDFFSDINKQHYFSLHYPEVDRYMLTILWCHFAVVSLLALAIYYFAPATYYPSPFSWRVIDLPSTLAVIALGFLACILPTALLGKIKNHYYYRLLVINCLFVFSYLIVFDTGGSIEAHFHFFVVLALLAIYFDWRLGWVGVVVVALHHSILDFVKPDWVYFYGRNDISVVAHALPVAIAALYITWIAENGRKSVERMAVANKILEDKLREKIPELNTDRS
jgi:glucose-6-phosphate-specific signal transduction histidine kinase